MGSDGKEKQTTSLPAKIVLATDGSEDATAAIRAAVDIAVGGGSELHPVHSFGFIPPRGYMSVALRLKNVSSLTARKPATKNRPPHPRTHEDRGEGVAVGYAAPSPQDHTTGEASACQLVGQDRSRRSR